MKIFQGLKGWAGRVVTKSALLCLTAFALLLTPAQVAPASASAYGIDSWGQFCLNGKCFPSGSLEHYINGSGKTVNYEWADWESFANVCNWQVKFRYRDVNRKQYLLLQSAVFNSCGRNGTVYAYPTNLRYGTACAEIWSNGVRLTSQCHSITA